MCEIAHFFVLTAGGFWYNMKDYIGVKKWMN